jgi:hypothetical protein
MALDEAFVERLRSGMQGAARGGRVTQSQIDVARRALLGESLRCNPRGGRAAAVAEAAVVLRQMVGPAGRVKPPSVSKKQRKAARKAAKLAVKKTTQRPAESLEARVDRGIREALAMTATQAPQPAPGTGRAPLASGEARLAASFDAAATTLGGPRLSPFWNPPGTGTAGTGRSGKAAPAVASADKLAAMSADELHAEGRDVFAAYGQARGLGSPAWQ